MCLLDRMTAWSPSAIECVAVNHRDPRHPLRSASGLLASAAIEYAAQAMAVHGALAGRRRQAAARRPAFSPARATSGSHACRLDDLRPSARELVVSAERQAGDAARSCTHFACCTTSAARLRADRSRPRRRSETRMTAPAPTAGARSSPARAAASARRSPAPRPRRRARDRARQRRLDARARSSSESSPPAAAARRSRST